MTIIQLSDIKNEKIVSKIQDKDKAIKNYLKNLNELFPQEFQVNLDKMIFEIHVTKDHAYENDGNTRCEGKKYDILWSFAFTEDAIYDWFHYYNNMLSQAIAFSLDISERVHDGKVADHIGFQGYIGGFPQGNQQHTSSRFFLYSCSKFETLSLIKKVNEMYEDYKILQQMKKQELEFTLTLH